MYEFLQETVADNMTRHVKCVAPETTVGDLHRLFAVDEFDAYPVLRDDVVVGLVSKFDAMKPFAFTPDCILPHYDDLVGTTVDEIMSRNVVFVDVETKLQRVLQMMVTQRLKSVPVLDKAGCLVGIIARSDVLRALDRCSEQRDRQQPGAPEPLQCLYIA
ncbi:CBS domain-containing protein [Bradyrhizobium sp. dw_78]|uniref:CBS domain-containing protein n=1 Tax=Bradyrhizobium sp. dw_78 TaxID=2719793 RepID=UPI001BD588C1|nr:CBS domain-containing protein [Bradyrhizobium sp. dw_78]